MLCYATHGSNTPSHFYLYGTPTYIFFVNIVYTAASGTTHMHAVESTPSSSSSSFPPLCYAMLCYATSYHTTCVLLIVEPLLSVLCYAMSW